MSKTDLYIAKGILSEASQEEQESAKECIFKLNELRKQYPDHLFALAIGIFALEFQLELGG